MMNFHIGKIYNMPNNFFFYKANQPRLWMEYCKKVIIPEINTSCIEYCKKVRNPEINTSCIEYCKNIVVFYENNEPEPELDEKTNSDDDSWIDMKKYL